MDETKDKDGLIIESKMRDTRRNVRYIIQASRKLTRDEMLREIRLHNYNNLNIKVRSGDVVTIKSDI